MLDAWAYIDDLPARSTGAHGPLAGVPFAVKDIIDVEGQPTRCGSAAFADALPAAVDAAVVSVLREAGAVPVGKTHTTEFAFVDPTTTRNPHDPRRTPGGSSSGSGAVVGAGIVPFALGTQTAGSLCRPATYCGAWSYKPGLGVLPTTGMAPLAPSFDAIGVIAGSSEWLLRVVDLLSKGFAIPAPSHAGGSLRIGMVDVPGQEPASSMRQAVSRAVSSFRALGHSVEVAITPVSFQDIIEKHRTVMLFEMALHLGPRVLGKERLLRPRFRAGLAEGAAISPQQAADALGWLSRTARLFWDGLSGFDLLMAYPVPGAAPLGLQSTGDQSYLTPWTALTGPLVSVPTGHDENGMPLGILLAARPGADADLVRAAQRLGHVLPPIRRPSPPDSVRV